jgi:hypothetical protein
MDINTNNEHTMVVILWILFRVRLFRTVTRERKNSK